MGILSNIFGKIFPKSHAANKGPAPQAQAQPQAQPQAQAQAAPAPQAQPQVQQQAPAAAAPAAMDQVDVEEILTAKQQASGQQLNWRTSIVDLLKLLDLDSSLTARQELAKELNCPADKMGDSAQMNMWLHKAVLQKLADNGGNVPADLL